MDSKLLKEEINDLKKYNIEETIAVIKYSLLQYVKSLLRYGSTNLITKNNLELLKIYFANLKEEYSFYKILLNNHKNLFYADTLEFLNNLNDWQEVFISYIYQCLDDLEDAYEMGIEYRASFPKKDFAFLTESMQYQNEIIRLLLGESVLLNYFQYPIEFWNYMKSRTIILNEGIDDQEFVGVYPKLDQYNRVENLKMFVPQIIDLKTLLINIHEYNHAYMLYSRLGKAFEEANYEDLAKAEEKNFMENYFEPLKEKIFIKRK